MATVRRVARWAHLIAIGIFLLAVVVQFFLAGLGVFRETSFDAHADVGWAMQLLAVLIFLLALLGWLPRVDIGLSLLLAVLAFVQNGLPSAESGWVQALHPVNALVLFVLAHQIVRRDRRLLAAQPAPAMAEAP